MKAPSRTAAHQPFATADRFPLKDNNKKPSELEGFLFTVFMPHWNAATIVAFRKRWIPGSSPGMT
jgi:hypothetical protein